MTASSLRRKYYYLLIVILSPFFYTCLYAQSYVPAELLNLKDVISKIQAPQSNNLTITDGKVVVRVWVQADSSVVLDRIIRSSDTLLSDAVIQQLSELKGIPALRDGKYQREGVTFPVQFLAKIETVSFQQRMDNLNWRYFESGLGYVWIDSLDGPPLKYNKMGAIHYTGFLGDGTCFDTSKSGKQKPLEIMVGRTRLIAGWEEAIQVFPAGSRVWLKIPPELAYGTNGTDGIPPQSTLYFDMQILK